jgi:hypothetical protein
MNGRLPGYDKARLGGTSQNIDPDKAAFSMAPHDDDAYAPVNMNDHDHRDEETGYGGGYGVPSNGYGSDPYQSSQHQDNPFDDHNHSYGRPQQTSPFDDHAAADYRPHSGQGGGRPYAPPSAEDYVDDRPAQFPAGNYDRGA